MSLFSVKRSVIFLLTFLAACQAPTPAEFAGPSPTHMPAATRLPFPTYTATPLPPTTIPSPTPDPDVITPGNVTRLVQLKLLGIGSMTTSPLYSPDGRWLLVPTTTGVMIYDTATYRNGRLLVSGFGWGPAKAISPDGKTLAIGSKLVAIDDGHELRSLDVPSGFVNGKDAIYSVRQARFSPDGQMLALVYTNDQIGVWHIGDGQLLYTLQGESIDFSADSRLIVTRPDSSSEDPHIYMYDAQTGSLLRDWPGGWAAFLPDVRLAVEASGALRVFDLSTGKVPSAFNGTHAAFSPDGKYVALLLYNQVSIYEVSEGELVSKPEGDLSGVDRLTLQFSPDGQTLVGYAYWGYCCGGSDNLLFLWRVADGALIRKEKRWIFAHAPDGRSLLAGAEIWDTSNGSTRARLDGYFTGYLPTLAFSPDSRELVAQSGDRLLFFPIDQEQLELIQADSLDIPADRFVGIPSREIDLPDYDFWRSSAGNALDALTLEIIKGLPLGSTGAVFSPDGNWVATRDRDVLLLWKNGEQTPVLEQKVCINATISSIAFSPDGQRLALACANDWYEYYEDQIVQVWQVASQGRRLTELTAEYPGHGYNLLAYSPDGQILAAARGSIDLWSTSEGKLLFTFEPGDNFGAFSDPTVVGMTFSPDGQILAFGRRIGGSVELWSTQSGQKLLELPRLNHANVLGVAFSADGKLLATSLDDGSVRLWGVK